MSDWKEAKLDSIAALSKKGWKVGDEHAPYIGLEHIGEGSLRLIGIGDSKNVVSNKYWFTKNEFLFGKLRPYFRKVIRPNFDGICSTDIWVVKNRKNVDKDFLYYLFATNEFVDLANSGSSGTKMPRADWNFVKETYWIIPENIEEQKAIADVLSSLDDKIDLLQRQNKTLEQLAQSLFRQWFIEEAQDEWQEGCLGDLVFFEYGKGLKKSDRTGTGYPVVGSSGIVDYHSEYLVEGPGIVTGRKGTLGEVIYLSENFFPIDTTFYITSKNNSKGLYFEYFLLKSIGFENMNTDSAVPGLNRNNALSSEVVVPPASEIYKFNDMVAPIFQKMILNINQIRTLETLRDTLLPKLISGEVRVCYESFPVRETIKEPYLPWLENTWLAILEVVYRISKQPYANHIGQTIFQKVCYIMTEETGLPLRLQYEQGDFGPFSKQITPVLQKLSKEKFVKKHSLGKMDEILLTQNYEQHRDNFLPIIAQFEDNIQKTVDLFCRIKNTEQAEEVATVLYAARQLLDVNTKNKVSEQQVLDYVLEWKPQWQEEIKREAIGIAIRNLGGLGWLDLEYCDSLPDESL